MVIHDSLFQIGDLPGHYHFRHDDVDELNKEHNRDKTDKLLLEKEVCCLHGKVLQVMLLFIVDGYPEKILNIGKILHFDWAILRKFCLLYIVEGAMVMTVVIQTRRWPRFISSALVTTWKSFLASMSLSPWPHL